MSNIDIFTFVSKNSPPYNEFLKYTCEKFSSKKHDIKWKCVESIGADRLPKGFDCVKKIEQDVCHSSFNHSIALNAAIDHIDSEYVIFADADIAILYPEWDDIVVNKLASGLGCFGFSFPNGIHKYFDFPNVFFFCFRADMLNDVELDFRPKLNKGQESVARYTLTDKDEANYFNRKLGEQIKCDTGWKLPISIRSKGYEGEALGCVQMNSKDRLLPFANKTQKRFCLQKPTHMAEWHYCNKIFGTHKQACRSHAFDGKWGRTWVERVKLYTKLNFGFTL